MAYICFWVQSDCIKPEAFSCGGCAQYPYGDGSVAPPAVSADFGQQIMGVHIGLAELLAKKGIAKPEELDEAIARNIERLANQDKMLRDAVCGVDGVLDAMIRLEEPGKLDLYLALDEAGETDQNETAKKAAGALDDMVPPGTEIRVMIAPNGPAEPATSGGKEASGPKKRAAKTPAARKPAAKTAAKTPAAPKKTK